MLDAQLVEPGGRRRDTCVLATGDHDPSAESADVAGQAETDAAGRTRDHNHAFT